MRLYAKQTVYDQLVDRSGTIAVGGVSQALVSRNPDRCYLFFENISTEDLYVREDSAAQINVAGNIRICPGGAMCWEGAYVPSNPMFVIGATGGSAFTCKENSSSYGNLP